MKKLVDFYLKMNNCIFNGLSKNKIYYIFPVDIFFSYSISRKEESILEEHGIFVDNKKLSGYYDCYKLLKKIDSALNREFSSLSIYNKKITVQYNLEKLQRNRVLVKLQKIYNKYNGNQYFEYIIHGSYADSTNTPSSDIDDILFIRRNVLKTYKDFKKAINLSSKLNLFYQKIDFAQHHGHWIFTVYNKYFYNSAIMPFSVYDDSMSLTGDDLLLQFNSIEKNNNYRKIAKQILKELKEEYFRLKTDKINYYQLKNLISAVSLLVPLVFQINGKMYSKKIAIKNAKNILSDNTVKTIHWANEIRKNWNKLPFYNIQKVFFLFISMLFKNRNTVQFICSKVSFKLKKKDLLEVFPGNLHYLDEFIKEIYEIVH